MSEGSIRKARILRQTYPNVLVLGNVGDGQLVRRSTKRPLLLQLTVVIVIDETESEASSTCIG